MEASTKPSAEQVERELGELLDQETFEPPAGFRDKALIADESVHEEAARDPDAWWAKQAEALDWFERWDTVLDESEAPFYKWFTRRQAERLPQRARPPRRGRARRQGRASTGAARRARSAT